MVSFIWEHTSLGLFKVLRLLSSTGWNPLSWNETSLPSTLVPVTVLIDPLTLVKGDGVTIL